MLNATSSSTSYLGLEHHTSFGTQHAPTILLHVVVLDEHGLLYLRRPPPNGLPRPRASTSRQQVERRSSRLAGDWISGSVPEYLAKYRIDCALRSGKPDPEPTSHRLQCALFSMGAYPLFRSQLPAYSALSIDDEKPNYDSADLLLENGRSPDHRRSTSNSPWSCHAMTKCVGVGLLVILATTTAAIWWQWVVNIDRICLERTSAYCTHFQVALEDNMG